jgi:hypothetical protein
MPVRPLGIVMRTFSKLLRGKLLRGSCAIATSGALVLANFAAIAEELPSGAQPPLPPAAQDTLPPAAQQSGGPGSQQPPDVAAQRLGQGQLEKLLAPIALYPDDLVAQVLTASTYPIEVVAAARWVHEHPNVHGDGLRDAMAQQSWDASVKGLTAVPQVLEMMNDKLDWMQQLGEAFLAQPDDVTNAIQQLRGKAQANGNLNSSDKIRVSKVASPPPPPYEPPPPGMDPALWPPPPPPEFITIEPVDPAVYYVPIYDPYVVYGPWVWPAYAPFYWYPPGYVLGAAVIGFSVGFFVGSALWCHYNWGWYGGGWYGGGWRGGSPVTINVNRFNTFNRTNLVAGSNGMTNWQFNAAHRGTVGFQNAALRQQFGGTNLHGAGTFQHSLQGGQSGVQGGVQGNLHGPLGNANVNTNTKFNSNANLNRNANVNTNTKLNTNANINRNANVNTNTKFNTNTNMKLNTNMNVNTNTKLNTNANINRNVNVNQNVNRNVNVNQNVNQNVNRNVNVNQNVNRNVNVNQNVNRNVNVNRNINVNRSFNAGGNNRAGAGNVARAAGGQAGNKQHH